VVTPTQVWGPFYAGGAPFRAKLSPVGSVGEVLLLSGTVFALDTKKPVPFAVLDLWQASFEEANTKGGLYDYHETGSERRAYKEELNSVGKAKHYDFRGRAICDEQGRYEVETVMPSPYLDDEYEDPPGVWRCPHVHYYVTSPGYKPLVTQLYFKGLTGTPGGYEDKHALKASEALKKEVVEVRRTTGTKELLYKKVVFDIVIEPGTA